MTRWTGRVIRKTIDYVGVLPFEAANRAAASERLIQMGMAKSDDKWRVISQDVFDYELEALPDA